MTAPKQNARKHPGPISTRPDFLNRSQLRTRAALEICGWGSGDGSPPVRSRSEVPVRVLGEEVRPPEAKALSENRYQFLSKITAK